MSGCDSLADIETTNEVSCLKSDFHMAEEKANQNSDLVSSSKKNCSYL
jgi:hypothetical protein